MKSAIIIPARYSSSRFPGKPLVSLLGKPMIIWVAELCGKVLPKDCIFVATDDDRIAKCANDYGFNAVMTSNSAPTGTDRLAEAARQIDAEIYVNVQGDEPLINPNDILRIIDYKIDNPEFVVNGFCYLSHDEDPSSTNIPKVVTNESNRLLYMSRSLVPGKKSGDKRLPHYKKQVCIYAFTHDQLEAFSGFGRKSETESYEDIEILRFLDLDIPVSMVETSAGSLAVDVPNDVPLVEAALKKREST